MIEIDKIEKIINDAGISAEVEQEIHSCLVEVTIYWGDWKHDHGYLEYLMQQQGLSHVREELLEEDGSDCYSAKHIFGEKNFVEDVRKLFQTK